MTAPRPRLQGLRKPFAAALAAGLVAGLGSLLLPNAFRCEARILTDDGHGGAAWRSGVWAPSAQPEVPGNREDGPTVIYADILKSRRVAGDLLEAQYDYGYRAWRFGRERRAKGTLLQYLDAPNVDRALGAFRRLLTVDRNPKSGLLTLAAETHSPELSLQVTRRAVVELRAALVEFNQNQGRNRAKSSGDRLDEVRAQYQERTGAFRRFQEGNRNWEGSPSPNLRFQGLQMKEELALWQRVLENLTLNHEQALMEARNAAQTLLVLDPGVLPREKSGPHRAFIVVGAMALTGAATWAYLNHASFRDLFVAREPS